LNRFNIMLCLLASTAAATAAAVWRPDVRLVYDASASAPLGWYLIRPTEPARVGDYVLPTLIPAAAALAAQRGLLPAGVPLLKQVGAFARSACLHEGRRAAGRWNAIRPLLRSDSQGRPLSGWSQCRWLANAEVMLLGTTNPAPFDSRHFGPVLAPALRGRAVSLWTWSVS
jgi:type IV secretory pathway protease TraF